MTYLKLYFCTSLILLFCSNFGLCQTTSREHSETLYLKLQQADNYLDTKPDTAFKIYQELQTPFTELQDSSKLSRVHLGMSDIYKNRGQYSHAYDHLWDALLLATNNQHLLIKIHSELSALYGIFEKYEKSIEHLHQAVTITQSLISEKKLERHQLITPYFALAVQNRKHQNYHTALSYLDSCQNIRQTSVNYQETPAYIDAERGYISLLINDMKKAEYYLWKAKNYFSTTNGNYLSIINTFIGHFYVKNNQYEKAIEAYSQALEIIEKRKTHTDFKTEIYKQMAYSYQILGKFDLAYHHLHNANSLTDSLFNIKGNYNNQLFQIRNKYRETIKTQHDHIQTQNAIIEKEQLSQNRLKIIIGLLLIIALITAIIVRLKYRVKKFQLEKTEIEQQADLDKQNSNRLIQFKSRELTANTLQFIEKDKVIHELLDLVKQEAPKSYQKAKSQIALNNSDMWEQFNKRFIEVNSDFYTHLREKHPNLSPTEQKHCALIKLQFDSKEMTQILNISLNSVQISRHRIRKKMGLERNVNLSNYIADL